MSESRIKISIFIMIYILVLLVGLPLKADQVTEWNLKACDILLQAKMDPASANRVLAIVQTAVYEAVNSITKRYPAGDLKLEASPGTSVAAAIAAANHATLMRLVPSIQPVIENEYQTALSQIADSPAKTSGIIAGEKAAATILAMREDDGAAVMTAYRPPTSAGVYVPTIIPAVPQWPKRKPWLMASPSQFRPGPPPSLNSEIWARDFNEIKAFGSKNSSSRDEKQTEIALFWVTTAPSIYQKVVCSVADMPGREITQNARLFAMVTQAMDDALIAVFDAKYYYDFWRPMTAIRNGDIDNNDATERDSIWTPLIDTPMHPEYPCAHCIVSATVGTVLQAEIGLAPMPLLKSSSPTANNVEHSWNSIEDFMQEVANARIYGGVHYRTSTEVGTEMGRQIGKLAVLKFLKPLK